MPTPFPPTPSPATAAAPSARLHPPREYSRSGDWGETYARDGGASREASRDGLGLPTGSLGLPGSGGSRELPPPQREAPMGGPLPRFGSLGGGPPPPGRGRLPPAFDDRERRPFGGGDPVAGERSLPLPERGGYGGGSRDAWEHGGGASRDGFDRHGGFGGAGPGSRDGFPAGFGRGGRGGWGGGAGGRGSFDGPGGRGSFDGGSRPEGRGGGGGAGGGSGQYREPPQGR